jgi:integrase/recombinase XerD
VSNPLATSNVQNTTPTPLTQHFDRFVQAGQYLRNWSPKTVRSYKQAFSSLQQAVPGPEIPSKAQLEAWVVSMRDRGLSAGGCNVYIRSVNSFLSWLTAEELLERPVHLKLLRQTTTVIDVFTDAHVRAIITFKPATFIELRLLTLLQTLLDTGCRIEELLTVKETDVDFDNMLLTVMGKGSKERRVPFSMELRKTLYRFAQTKTKRGIRAAAFFCTCSGGRLSYFNVYRDIRLFCAKLGIVGPRISPHTFRHTFATNYLRHKGDIYKLSRILGHTDIRTTMRYLHLSPEDLRESMQRSSLLGLR